MNAHDVIESGVRAWEDRGGPVTPRILEAIEASGFALVELPARNTQGEWPVGDGNVVYFDGNDNEIWYRLLALDPAKARLVAAGLIAAADYADREAQS